jgi:hypothetical protein
MPQFDPYQQYLQQQRQQQPPGGGWAPDPNRQGYFMPAAYASNPGQWQQDFTRQNSPAGFGAQQGQMQIPPRPQSLPMLGGIQPPSGAMQRQQPMQQGQGAGNSMAGFLQMLQRSPQLMQYFQQMFAPGAQGLGGLGGMARQQSNIAGGMPGYPNAVQFPGGQMGGGYL